MTTDAPTTDLAPDHAVPARDVLLDPDNVAELLSNSTGVSVESCALRRAKYRVGESLRVVYDVGADGGTFVMSARTFSNAGAVYARAKEAATPVGVMPGAVHDPATGSVWWTVPNDRRLTNLATLLDAPLRVRKATGVPWDRARLVEYAPERSATAQLRDSDGDVVGYAKAYRDRDPLDLVAHYNAVSDSLAPVDGLRTPRAIGSARPDRIVVLEAMPGRSWRQLPAKEQPPAMTRLGAAVARVHQLPVRPHQQPVLRHRLDRLLHCAQLVAVARPDVAEVAARLAVQLANVPIAPAKPVCLHGDVHADNVLFHEDQVHLLDFDDSGPGAAAADLAGVLASLMTARLTGDAATTGLGVALLDGYRAVRRMPSPAELRWYTAAALLSERAIRGVNRVYRPTLAVLPKLLSLAEAVLTREVDLHA